MTSQESDGISSIDANVAEAIFAGYSLRLRNGLLQVIDGEAEEPEEGSTPLVANSPKTSPHVSAYLGAWRRPALHYNFAGRDLTFSADSDRIRALIEQLWSPFRSEDPSPAGFEIVAAHDGEGFVLSASGRVGRRLDSELQLNGLSQRTIVEHVYSEQRWLAVLHAGAVSYGRSAAAIMGSPRAGKSTLVAGLSRSGFRYFSDDCVPVTFGTEMACAVPTAVSLREGSWAPLAGRLPELEQLPSVVRGGNRVKYWFPNEHAVNAFRREPLEWIVYPTYAPAGEPFVRELESLDALRQFVRSGSSPGVDVDSDHLQRFADWLETRRHFAISYRSLDEAVDQVASVLSR
jgi:hypothetical protein